MAAAQKVEAQICLCVWCDCMRRWQHHCRAQLASATSVRVCGKNSRQKETKIQVQATFDRGHLSISLDFNSRFSRQKKLTDCKPGSCDPQSGPTHSSHPCDMPFISYKFMCAHAHTICGRLPQRIYFASLSAQSKFELFVSHI